MVQSGLEMALLKNPVWCQKGNQMKYAIRMLLEALCDIAVL